VIAIIAEIYRLDDLTAEVTEVSEPVGNV
jgi:hypothetical protein